MGEVISCGSIIEQSLIRIFFYQSTEYNFTSWCRIWGKVSEISRSDPSSDSLLLEMTNLIVRKFYRNEDSSLFFLLRHISIYGAAVCSPQCRSPLRHHQKECGEIALCSALTDLQWKEHCAPATS